MSTSWIEFYWLLYDIGSVSFFEAARVGWELELPYCRHPNGNRINP
jgi:hypothetical protein